eukprot:4594587-Pleurochrysis_carterae.AAC.1
MFQPLLGTAYAPSAGARGRGLVHGSEPLCRTAAAFAGAFGRAMLEMRVVGVMMPTSATVDAAL